MRTWKRLLLLCLTLALLTSALPAMAAEAELTYELRSSGVWITGPQDYSGDLVLPEEIEGSPVVGVAARAFSDNTGITSVTLPESLRYIEEAAFYNCRSLREPVLIPDDMEWIWPDAFYGNAISGKKYSAAERYDRLSRNQRFIQTGILPNCRTVWQDGMAFWIRDGEAELVSLPSEAEYTLYLPEEVAGAPLTSIGAFSFMAREYNRNHTRIKHVVLPISIKTVEPYAFYSTQLDSIFLHEGVQELKDYSLCTDYSNTVITLPASLERLGDHVFSRYYSAYYPLTVYAYGDSPAAQRAAYESAKLVDRIGSNGKRYGCYGGWYYTVENGQAELTRRMSYASNFIPDEIEGAVIRELDFDRISYGHSFKTIRIPPTVTNILDKEGRMRDTLFLVYPGSYAESFCKEKGYAYERFREDQAVEVFTARCGVVTARCVKHCVLYVFKLTRNIEIETEVADNARIAIDDLLIRGVDLCLRCLRADQLVALIEKIGDLDVIGKPLSGSGGNNVFALGICLDDARDRAEMIGIGKRAAAEFYDFNCHTGLLRTDVPFLQIVIRIDNIIICVFCRIVKYRKRIFSVCVHFSGNISTFGEKMGATLNSS